MSSLRWQLTRMNQWACAEWESRWTGRLDFITAGWYYLRDRKRIKARLARLASPPSPFEAP